MEENNNNANGNGINDGKQAQIDSESPWQGTAVIDI